jgi:hypothetical protein
MAERGFGAQSLALEASPAQAGHLGRGAGFVNEDKPVRECQESCVRAGY